MAYRISGAPVSLVEFAARAGFAQATADAMSALLEHIGEDPKTVRRTHEKAYLIMKAFQVEWQWSDVPDAAQMVLSRRPRQKDSPDFTGAPGKAGIADGVASGEGVWGRGPCEAPGSQQQTLRTGPGGSGPKFPSRCPTHTHKQFGSKWFGTIRETVSPRSHRTPPKAVERRHPFEQAG